MTPEAFVVHAVPGRTRIKVPSMRGDRVFFDGARESLLECPLVESLDCNPRTASILLRHDAPFAAVARFGEARQLFEVLPNGHFDASRGETDAGEPQALVRLLQENAGHWQPALVAALLLLAYRQARRGHVLGPATGYVLDALRLLKIIER